MPLQPNQILKLLNESRLEVTHKFDVPPIWMEIVNEDEQECRIYGTYGNFSTIVAPPKVGKTTLVAIIVAACLRKKTIAGFNPKIPKDKENVLFIDSEQGKGEALDTIKAICNFADYGTEKHPKNLNYWTFRKFGHSTRVELIDYLIYNTPNLGVIIIDGIRDLINSINDEREATFIVSKLLKWSEETNTHIITILHQNKGDGNARGHLGTELMNKAETVINLSKEMVSGVRQTNIEAKHTRHKEFRDFAITLQNNIPRMVGVTNYQPENPKTDQLTHIQKTALLESVFSKTTFLPYTKLWQTIKIELKHTCQIKFGDNKCKDLVAVLKNENYISYDENTKHFQKTV